MACCLICRVGLLRPGHAPRSRVAAVIQSSAPLRKRCAQGLRSDPGLYLARAESNPSVLPSRAGSVPSSSSRGPCDAAEIWFPDIYPCLAVRDFTVNAGLKLGACVLHDQLLRGGFEIKSNDSSRCRSYTTLMHAQQKVWSTEKIFRLAVEAPRRRPSCGKLCKAQQTVAWSTKKCIITKPSVDLASGDDSTINDHQTHMEPPAFVDGK